MNEKLLAKQFNHFMGQVIAAKASDFKPDMILSIAQAPLGPDAIKNLKLLDVPVAFWFVEDFRTLTYWKDIASSYDYFFTIQRGKFFDQLKSIGVDNFYYLPQACLPGVHRKINLSFTEMKKYSADVSFMGSGRHLEAPRRPLEVPSGGLSGHLEPLGLGLGPPNPPHSFLLCFTAKGGATDHFV